MSKLLALSGFLKNIYGQYRFQGMISGAVIVTGLVIFSAMLICMALIGVLCGAYMTLVYYGCEPLVAFLMTSGLFLLITLLFVYFTGLYLRRLYARLFQKSPLMTKVSQTIEAFFEGLMSEEPTAVK